MKKYFPLLALIFLLACDAVPADQETTEDTTTTETTTPEPTGPNTLTAAEQAEGWQLLFDGQSPSQWRGYNHDEFPTKGWAVEDGNLMVLHSGTEEEGFGGDIITRETYENFELKLDFQVTDTANSGIFYMVKEADGVAIWHNAPEYQVLDNATYATMGITNQHFTAANYDLHPATEDYTKPVGEWNEVRILINKGHVEHWLNGHQVVAYDLWTPEWDALVAASKFKDYPGYGRTKKGAIGLQDHGHTVKFRNIKIKTL